MDDKPVSRSHEKAVLRSEALRRRNGLDEEFRAVASVAIAERVDPLLARYVPDRVATYHPIGSECDPRRIAEAARVNGAQVALPAVVEKSHIVFRRFNLGDPLVPGGFGTLVPGPGAAEIEPDLIVLPLVGFDDSGARLGYGRGYYDGAIARLRRRPALIGIAFSVQKTEPIPVEPHDVRLDWVVTEDAIHDFTGKGRG